MENTQNQNTQNQNTQNQNTQNQNTQNQNTQKKKIILMQPRVGEWDEVRSHPSLPCALLSAARFLVKDYNVVLIDQRLKKEWKDRLKNELQDALCIGITSMTGIQLKYALEIAKFVKDNSNVPVVMGGINTSIMPETTLENPNVDIVVRDEGELTLKEMTDALAQSKSLEGIPGVGFKNDGKILMNEKRPFADLDTFPELPLHLIDLDKYLPMFKGRRTIYIETSRGCPNNCSYCYNTNYHKRHWRPMSAENTLKMIRRLVKDYNITSFYFLDDNFFVDTRRAETIMKAIIDEKMDIIWESQGITVRTAMTLDDDYIKLMERAGCRKVHFGIESGSQKILDMVHKNITPDEVLQVNRKFAGSKIVTQYNFMCGFPNETEDDIRKSIGLIFKLTEENENAIISPICTYTPYPGTEMWNDAARDGFKLPQKLEEFSNMEYGETPWVPKGKMKYLKGLFFASLFLDKHRSQDMFTSPILKLAVAIYRPIARFRVKHLFFSFMPEMVLTNFVLKRLE